MSTLTAGILVAVGGSLVLIGCNMTGASSADSKFRSSLAETVSLVADSTTALVGIRTFEQPRYERLRKDGEFEVREYEPIVAVRTQAGASGSSDGQAFGRLFQYIGGSNAAGRKIAMTAPVLMTDSREAVAGDGESPMGDSHMYFILPGRFGIDDAPDPADEKVETMRMAPKRYATVRFSGVLGDDLAAKKADELRQWMKQQGLTAVGEPIQAGYDPPYTLPFLRRNEVWIEIE